MTHEEHVALMEAAARAVAVNSGYLHGLPFDKFVYILYAVVVSSGCLLFVLVYRYIKRSRTKAS
jgi:hypothetical protein